ncbi:MAG: hypothetical protein Q8P57_00355 [Candidatus Pacearchaeota archaeon]|nr:hypothetical protein [Candidatus Pacearchaeota archaeon]
MLIRRPEITISKPAISRETRDFLRKEVDRYLVSQQDGSDLGSAILEVLNDRNIFTFLAMHSRRGQGLSLGRMSYWDDAGVYAHYGLALDFDNIPRMTRLYNFTSIEASGRFCEQEDLRLGDGIYFNPHFSGLLPSAEGFVRQVNSVLMNPKQHLIELHLKPNV